MKTDGQKAPCEALRGDLTAARIWASIGTHWLAICDLWRDMAPERYSERLAQQMALSLVEEIEASSSPMTPPAEAPTLTTVQELMCPQGLKLAPAVVESVQLLAKAGHVDEAFAVILVALRKGTEQ